MSSRPTTTTMPTDCWYAAAASPDVGRHLLAVRPLETPVVLWRTEGGDVVALQDRCAHRAYPLSAGALDGDTVRCGLCGFEYDTGGQCVAVPTQPRVPFGAHVASYPVQERDGVVWLWLGESGRARLHRVPELPWLTDERWSTVGDTAEVAAGALLLHENFADVTQVPFVAPEIAPAALASAPPLEVVVTETTVQLRREFPPSPLPAWQAEMLGTVDVDGTTVQGGFFLSPAAWVDHWDTSYEGGIARLRFTQLVTPVDDASSRLHWRVSRDFAVGDPAADARMQEMFADYYARVQTAMETAQATLHCYGAGPEVNVAADVAALRVREIVRGMVAEERAWLTRHAHV
ncbi:aromatic ring-hydroxylating dioxygenase subunit alpha [Nocardioides cynanchi]|uniref:aromatic ring-hydroxylating dioxygenase subunit alpha n=1 Tax=Nocardioides cynanchi TaxID=2558918 RepID=UPI0012443771|nr:aromatic ring-hydroxylating dioxygenase subunit alpha [Nocardioides cynanchi]